MIRLLSIIAIVLSFLITNVFADDKGWQLHRFNVYFEDDIYTQTDDEYSAGERLALVFHVLNPKSGLYNLLFLDDKETDTYTSFALTNQILTPTDTQETELITDDRPYAGWTYFETGMHRSTESVLRSFYLQIGVVGPSSEAEELQNGVHEIIDSEEVEGWDNQLEDELGINLRYIHKSRFVPKPLGSFESSIIPYIEGDLGNISIKATTGIVMRFGWNIPKDFGVSTIDLGGEDGIPIYHEHEAMRKKNWSFSFNLSGGVSLVGRDIFLDGNTFADSHSVEKEPVVGYIGYGFSVRYKRLIFDFMETINTKKFEEQSGTHGVGTMVLSWLF